MTVSAKARTADLVIVGLGLAGSALAWRAAGQGLDVMIVDAAEASAASRVAAGLVTPVTGARLKPQPGFDELAAAATTHYREVAGITGIETYHERPAIRLLTGRKELDAWRALDAGGHPLAVGWDRALPAGIRAAGTPVCMPAAGRLAIADYVAATRDYFGARDALIEATVDDAAVEACGRSVRLNGLGLEAEHVVFCRGYRDRDNRYFPGLGWRAAKGQILELECPEFDRRFTVHAGGIWLTASGATRVLAGATYEWETLDATPTPEARAHLEEQVGTVIDLPFEVVDQRAAVRPIVQGRLPVIGPSETSRRVWLFNGLGSKGALFAPGVAAALLSAIADDTPLPPAYSLAGRLVPPA